MLIIGLTGGIASGKTTVSDLFAGYGVPVVDADVAARRVVEPGEPALAELAAALGEDILNADGGLDRQALRRRAFSDERTRRRIEAILHPRIREWMQARVSASTGPYAILSVPLLVESDLLDTVSRVLVVDVPEDVQRRRLRERDGGSAEEADAILAAQSPREVRLRYADDIIVNTGDPEALRERVRQLHEHYLALAAAAGGAGTGTAEA